MLPSGHEGILAQFDKMMPLDIANAIKGMKDVAQKVDALAALKGLPKFSYILKYLAMTEHTDGLVAIVNAMPSVEDQDAFVDALPLTEKTMVRVRRIVPEAPRTPDSMGGVVGGVLGGLGATAVGGGILSAAAIEHAKDRMTRLTEGTALRYPKIAPSKLSSALQARFAKAGVMSVEVIGEDDPTSQTYVISAVSGVRETEMLRVIVVNTEKATEVQVGATNTDRAEQNLRQVAGFLENVLEDALDGGRFDASGHIQDGAVHAEHLNQASSDVGIVERVCSVIEELGRTAMNERYARLDTYRGLQKVNTECGQCGLAIERETKNACTCGRGYPVLVDVSVYAKEFGPDANAPVAY